MNIAEQLRAFYIDIDFSTGVEKVNDWPSFIAECELKCNGDPEYDCDVETTTYYFVDGSVLEIRYDDGQIVPYGCKG